jgi:hypothetical protein
MTIFKLTIFENVTISGFWNLYALATGNTGLYTEVATPCNLQLVTGFPGNWKLVTGNHCCFLLAACSLRLEAFR